MMTLHDGLLVETIVNGPIAENCYIAADAATRRAVLIDPGDEERRVLERVRALDLEIREIVCTHGHFDHAGAVAPLQRELGVPFAIHAGDRDWLAQIAEQAAYFGLPAKETPHVDRELVAGASIQVGDLVACVLHTPGHSAGGCCLYFAEQQVVFVGDTLFAGSVGRTDLPGGSSQQLLHSIREQLLTLDDAVVVYSGHGPATTIGTERRSNALLQPGAERFLD